MPAADIESRNRLGDETSPYLLQHRHNPVHWWPWGPEAFEAARALDRPIFLSVGYSTCYWCHVMERESFEDEATAAILNEHFVAIKVDREERPDVDDIYMRAVQALNNGQGGWPMTVFLEPSTLKPFLAGTYFPPEDNFGRPGFKSALNQIITLWNEQRAAVLGQADEIGAYVARSLTESGEPVPLDASVVDRAVTQLLGAYDRTHGGFGQGQKFPMPANLDLLVDAAWDETAAREAVIQTLDRMARGGIYDQIGGGFHRYAVDQVWLVPHFEKMLYDNGQLARTYALVHERTGDPYYAEIVRETLDYVLREMTAEGGAFLSAQDAEVNHREGQNYLWIGDEVRDALTAAGLQDHVDFALDVYGLAAGTNFRDPHHPGEPPRNVIHLVEHPAALAVRHDMTPEAFAERVRRINAALYDVRQQRDQPATDDKILVAWNGLMIAGFAEGGRALGEPRYVDAAARAAAFILANMRTDDGGLLRTTRGGTARIDAFCEDYASLIDGLLALHAASSDPAHLAAAVELADAARSRFWDDAHGGFFDTLVGQSDLFVRVKSTYDGAVPCGNNLMARNLVTLYDRTGDTRHLDDAVRTLEAMSKTLVEQPTGAVVAVQALHDILERHPGRFVAGDAIDSVPTASADRPVVVSASVAEISIAAGGESTIDVRVALASGYHVNSHEPGLEYLIPLEVSLVGGAGVEATVDYPAGERFDGPDGVMYVHHGNVTIPVRLTRGAAVAEPPRLTITYQVCTDEYCLAPETEVLDVKIAVP